MKKFMVLSMSVLSVVALVGCGKKEEVVVTPPVEVVKPIAIDVPQGDFSEYQLNVDIVSTDVEGVEYGVKTKMYKKGDKALYVINEMTGPQDLPFTPTQNLLVGTDLYSNIEINGESMWFKAANIDEQGGAMFDLALMQEQLLQVDQISEQKEEEINGQMMTCYYTKASEGKVCLVDGIFAYGEDADPTSGMRSVISVSNYEKTVDDSVFVLPNEDEVKDMSEFMKLMMEQLQADGVDLQVAPEGEVVGEADVAGEVVAPGVVPDPAVAPVPAQ